jgi:hypothetical protein
VTEQDEVSVGVRGGHLVVRPCDARMEGGLCLSRSRGRAEMISWRNGVVWWCIRGGGGMGGGGDNQQ